MTYHAPLADIALALKYGASLAPAIEQGLFGDLSMEDVDASPEAGRSPRSAGTAQPDR